MPSRVVGNLGVAMAFAVFAVFAFFANHDTKAWREHLLNITIGGSSGSSSESRTATTGQPAKTGGEAAAAAKAAAAAAKAKAKAGSAAKADAAAKKSPANPAAAAAAPAAEEKAAASPAAPAKAKTPLSKEVKDDATGLVLPRTKRFGKADLTCLGVGVRAKSIAVAKVNVYTVGLYVEAKGARGALKKYAGSDPAALSKDNSLFKVLGQPGGFAKYLHLVFARSVGAQKVVDALTSVKGVGQDVLDRFSSITLDAVGKNIGKGESVTLGWEGKDKMVVLVRDKVAGTVVDAALPKAVFDLFLGSSPVSPPAKAAFAEGVPAFLAS